MCSDTLSVSAPSRIPIVRTRDLAIGAAGDRRPSPAYGPKFACEWKLTMRHGTISRW